MMPYHQKWSKINFTFKNLHFLIKCHETFYLKAVTFKTPMILGITFDFCFVQHFDKTFDNLTDQLKLLNLHIRDCSVLLDRLIEDVVGEDEAESIKWKKEIREFTKDLTLICIKWVPEDPDTFLVTSSTRKMPKCSDSMNSSIFMPENI